MSEERVKRKLSAILSADVVGYSRLMQKDEVSTVRTLEAYRKVMSDLIDQFRGRVVDSPGDNLLSEFGSVVDAVQCAVEIHEVIRAKNEELPEDRRMLFRIGVNLGDVIEEGDRIYGDGVNIAARLEGLADAGGICISGSAHEQIKNKLALGYEYIGKHTVKNITEPLKVYRVPVGPKTAFYKEGDEKKAILKKWRWTALGAAGAIVVVIGALAIWNFSFRQAPIATDVREVPKTIAVLPFDDISPEKDQEYFVDGLSEEILNSLAQIPDLNVTGRTSSFAFKRKGKTAQEIAEILGVENILEGSVRKAGNILRITAQLLRGADGFHLWSNSYDRELKDVDDILSIQEDIATAVANELKLKLGIRESLKQLGGTDNLEAYELYLIAKAQISNWETIAALETIEKAISLDQSYALAWALKGVIHWYELSVTPAKDVASKRDLGLNSALKAVELEPKLAEAYYSLGVSRFVRGELIKAELAYRKAMEMKYDPATCHNFGFPAYSLTVGHYERANEIIEAFRQIDPLNWQNYNNSMHLSGLQGKVQEAEEKFKHAKTLFANLNYGVGPMISVMRFRSRDVLTPDDIVFSDPIFDIAKQYIGNKEGGLVKLRQIYINEENLSSQDFFAVSAWAAYFGDPELALEAMEKGVSINAVLFAYTWFPVFHEVRQLPRFKEFVKEIGLVDYWKRFGWPDSHICRPVGDDDFVCE
jgi:TolB-like protein/class 3 adenylate cyclase/Tfp pilus assembly protein PilF